MSKFSSDGPWHDGAIERLHETIAQAEFDGTVSRRGAREVRLTRGDGARRLRLRLVARHADRLPCVVVADYERLGNRWTKLTSISSDDTERVRALWKQAIRVSKRRQRAATAARKQMERIVGDIERRAVFGELTAL